MAIFAFSGFRKSVTIPTWPISLDYATSTASPDSFPSTASAAFSAIRGPSLLRSNAFKKNGLRHLRTGSPRPLRQAAPTRPRSLVRRQAGLPRLRTPQSLLSPVRGREERRSRLARRQSALHQAVRLFRRTPMPRDHRARGGGRTAPRLARRQGTRKTVHAGTVATGRAAFAARHRHRRKSPSAKATTTASSSATCSAGGRSGSAARIAPKRAWTPSTHGWGLENRAKSAWR